MAKAKPPKLPSPTQLMIESGKADQLLESVLAGETDIAVIIDTIEGETQFLEKMDQTVDYMQAYKAMVAQLETRAKRYNVRIEKARTIINRILDKIGVTKIERAEYTAVMAAGRPSVMINDLSRIPRAYLAPDKNAIAEALKSGLDVPGASLNNTPPVLRINTK